MIPPERPPTIVPIVTPQTDDPATSGRIRNLSCSPTVAHDWLLRDESGYALRPSYTRAGYALLEDVYSQEGNPQGWARYQAYIAAWQSGKARRKPFPRSELPNEVLRRQACGDIDSAEETAKRSPPTTGRVSKSKE